MRKKQTEKYYYYGSTVLFCVILVVGLLALLVDTQEIERKRPQPGGTVVEKEKKEQENRTGKKIRVVIKTDGFQKIEHDKVTVKAKSGLIVHYGKKTKKYGTGEKLTVFADHEMFQGGTIKIEPKKKKDKIIIESLRRGYGVPSYRGKLELYSTSGGVAVVNELLLEEYLYAVVPSEMPASYELEALKAQAVCARSYAAKQTRNYSYPEYKAHVDDSTAFQVYGNSKEQKRAIQAVNKTKGEKVWYRDKVATTYYFSTSCGRTTSAEAWGSKKSKSNAYLDSVRVKGKDGYYEEKLPWFKWTARIDEKTLSQLISANTRTNIGELKRVEITKRGPGNIALQMKAAGDAGSVTVDTENKIRSALGGSGYTIKRQDGTSVKSSALLPSAFFTITKKGTEYVIKGGGFGHGIGMSQNGANEMAKEGKTYKEILKLFYREIEIRK